MDYLKLKIFFYLLLREVPFNTIDKIMEQVSEFSSDTLIFSSRHLEELTEDLIDRLVGGRHALLWPQIRGGGLDSVKATRMFAYPDSKCAWGYMMICDQCYSKSPNHVDCNKPINNPTGAGQLHKCEICGRNFILESS